MQQGAMPALRLIPELRGPAQVLRYGGGHAADDLSDNLESRKVTDRQRRWVIARGGSGGRVPTQQETCSTAFEGNKNNSGWRSGCTLLF